MEGARQPQAPRQGGGSVIDLQPRRRLASWTAAFNEYTAGLGSPDLFCKWAGISTVAAALERKVWTTTTRGELFPNLFTLIVGPPGVGKTLATGEAAWPLLAELKDHFLGATNVSRASLVDNMIEAERRIVKPAAGVVSFHALTVLSNELGVLLPSYENDFMSLLTDIYDGRKYEEKKRTRDLHLRMERPCLNLLAATTPSYLNNLLPEGAWDQGFLSRCILIYSGETKVVDLWSHSERDQKLFGDLLVDLKAIGDLWGEISIADDVRIAFMNWMKAGAEPRPEHPKLTTYTTRRPAHLLKLCMIASVSRSSEMVVNLDDFHLAKDWLLEAEVYMPDIFKAMNTGGDSNAIKDTWYYAFHRFRKDQKPVPEHIIVSHVAERVPAHSVARVIENMVKMRIFEEVMVPKVGKCYIPKAKSPHA